MLPANIRKDLCIDEIQELWNAYRQKSYEDILSIYIKKSGACMKLIHFAPDWDIVLRFECFGAYSFSVRVKS